MNNQLDINNLPDHNNYSNIISQSGTASCFHILDTYHLYQQMLSLPDEERTAFFDSMLLNPFAPHFQLTGMPRDAELLSCLSLTGTDEMAYDMLNQLKEAGAWEKAQPAMEQAAAYLQAAGIKVPKDITAGIFLGDPQKLSFTQGYTGVGSIPGYIMIIISPNAENLPKLQSLMAHELHHNILFYNVAWDFMKVSLSQYLAFEGMAESFAASLYSDKAIGPWVTGVSKDELETSRKIVGKNLDTAGFMEVQKYIFGKHPMIPDSDSLGIPYCGGYALGYHAVQKYLKDHNKTIAQATKAFIEGEDIIKQSAYFND